MDELGTFLLEISRRAAKTDPSNAAFTVAGYSHATKTPPKAAVENPTDGAEARWQPGRHYIVCQLSRGKLDRLPWPQKSPTKQRVARQPDPAPPQGTLFDGLADNEFAGLIMLATATDQLDMETFVVAHTLDPFSQSMELVFGRPRLNSGGGEAWHWSQDLLVVPPSDGGRRVDDSPSPQSPDAAPDAPVRLRRPPSEQDGSEASGAT